MQTLEQRRHLARSAETTGFGSSLVPLRCSRSESASALDPIPLSGRLFPSLFLPMILLTPAEKQPLRGVIVRTEALEKRRSLARGEIYFASSLVPLRFSRSESVPLYE